jgi:hypothetical protein
MGRAGPPPLRWVPTSQPRTYGKTCKGCHWLSWRWSKVAVGIGREGRWPSLTVGTRTQRLASCVLRPSAQQERVSSDQVRRHWSRLSPGRKPPLGSLRRWSVIQGAPWVSQKRPPVCYLTRRSDQQGTGFFEQHSCRQAREWHSLSSLVPFSVMVQRARGHMIDGLPCGR